MAARVRVGKIGLESIGDHVRACGREERPLAHEIHIALDAVAYCAFKQRWEDVTRLACQWRDGPRGDSGPIRRAHDRGRKSNWLRRMGGLWTVLTERRPRSGCGAEGRASCTELSRSVGDSL